MLPDVRLLAVLDPAVLNGRDLVGAALAAQSGGATAVQLRLKGTSAADYFRATTSLVAALAIPVYVNDRADIAWAAGASGVHLGQEDVPAAAVRTLFPPPFRIGLSVGSPQEAAKSMNAGADYWSVGPLYRTASKPDAGVPLGPEGFAALARLAPPGLPVIGIGGITVTNAAAVMQAGAAGVAVIGAIFGAADVTQATRELRTVVERS
jgi:thiamine-phosphate pyrophosphorylase